MNKNIEQLIQDAKDCGALVEQYMLSTPKPFRISITPAQLAALYNKWQSEFMINTVFLAILLAAILGGVALYLHQITVPEYLWIIYTVGITAWLIFCTPRK